MGILQVLVVSVACFVMLNHWAIPKVKRRIRWEASAAGLAKLAPLSVLLTLRTVALLAAIASIAVVAMVGIVGHAGAASLPKLAATLEMAREWRAFLLGISPAWSACTVAALTVILCLVARRSAKDRADGIARARFQEEMERLQREHVEGNWEDLPSTPEMQHIEQAIVRVNGTLAALSQHDSAVGELKSDLVQLVSLHRTLDLSRRVDLTIALETIFHKPRNWRERLHTLFLSEGAVGTLRGARRIVFLVSLALLLPSLAGTHSGVAGGMLGRRVVELQDVYLETSASEARTSLDAALANGLTTDGLAPSNTVVAASSDEDDRLIEDLATAAERAVISGDRGGSATEQPRSEEDAGTAAEAPPRSVSLISRLGRSDVSNPGPDQDLANARNPFVRRDILRQASSQARWQIKAKPALAFGRDTTPLERAAMSRMDKPMEARGAVSARVKIKLEAIRAKSPGAWATIKTRTADWHASFSRPATSQQVADALGGEVLGVAMDATSTAIPEVQSLAAPIRETYGAAPLERLVHAKGDRFVVDLMEGGPTQALKNAGEGSLTRYGFSTNPMNALQALPKDSIRPDVVERNLPGILERPADQARAAEAVIVYSEKNTLPSRLRGTYGEVFPPDPNPISVRSPLGPEPKPPSGSSVHDFFRAREFESLRGFEDVGGVLLGRSPEGGTIDLRGFSWDEQGSTVILVLRRADGKELRKGPFKKSIVAQALAFAADGRLVVATILSTPPLRDDQILLHPAFLDTPLGCQTTALDRFVFDFTEGSKLATDARHRVTAYDTLYKRAWGVRLLSIAKGLGGDALRKLTAEQRSVMLEAIEAVPNDSPELDRLAKDALAQSDGLAVASKSPLAAKPEYYDSSLVADLRACASPSLSLDKFDQCIKQRTDGNLRKYPVERISQWAAKPPEFGVYSSTHERAFRISPELSWLSPPPSKRPAQADWPVEMDMQITFRTPPSFVREKVAATFDDKAPWEFVELKDLIYESVEKGLDARPEAQAIFANAWELTVLQRFFRLALEDRLGSAFPVQKLSKLAGAVSSAVSESHTARWQSRPSELEREISGLLRYGGKVMAEATGPAAASSDETAYLASVQTTSVQCATWLDGEIVNGRRGGDINDASWTAHCDFQDLRAKMPSSLKGVEFADELSPKERIAKRIVELGSELSQARIVRRKLGVSDDEYAPQVCPPL